MLQLEKLHFAGREGRGDQKPKLWEEQKEEREACRLKREEKMLEEQRKLQERRERMQEEQLKEQQRMLEDQQREQEKQQKHDLKMMCLQPEQNRKVTVAPKYYLT